ncbi:uncharacterized protein [Drosophila takahashii]|uniref:uncharacterized protein isoform X1 n=1 Tax=Drosophila takahashii TaxID=29030 RepID=UPI00389918A3
MLESEEQRLLVASCYMAHERSAPPDELSSLVELGSKDDQLLIGADANAHHSVWGSSDINDRVQWASIVSTKSCKEELRTSIKECGMVVRDYCIGNWMMLRQQDRMPGLVLEVPSLSKNGHKDRSLLLGGSGFLVLLTETRYAFRL